MDRAENAEVGSGTSITRSAENLSASVDMGEDAKVGGNGDGGDNETVEKITFQEVERTYGVSYLPMLRKDEFPLIVFGHCWSSQLKALSTRL